MYRRGVQTPPSVSFPHAGPWRREQRLGPLGPWLLPPRALRHPQASASRFISTLLHVCVLVLYFSELPFLCSCPKNGKSHTSFGFDVRRVPLSRRCFRPSRGAVPCPGPCCRSWPRWPPRSSRLGRRRPRARPRLPWLRPHVARDVLTPCAGPPPCAPPPTAPSVAPAALPPAARV